MIKIQIKSDVPKGKIHEKKVLYDLISDHVKFGLENGKIIIDISDIVEELHKLIGGLTND